MHGRILAFGFWFLALAVACASGGDDDDDSDSTGDDDYDPNQGPEPGDGDDTDDDDSTDDDASADDDSDDDDADDDADDDVAPSCSDAWDECFADHPRETDFEDECGPYPASDDPDFVNKWADFNACSSIVLSHWAGDVHDCGVTAGCDDATAAYYACLETWYEETAWCYSTGGPDLLDYAECLPAFECDLP